MGKFEDSFKRQVRRDTGKFVSNLIFGNKHATPIRIRKKELDLKQEHLKQERLNQICLEISQKIESLAEFEFPNEKNEVIKI